MGLLGDIAGSVAGSLFGGGDGGGGGGGGFSVSAEAFKKAEGIRNKAYRDAANWRKITAFAVALVNAYQLIDNFKKQKKLADRTYKMSEELHNRLVNKFFPLELKFLKEFGYDGGENIEPIKDYAERYGGRLRATVADTYAKKLKQLICQSPRYCASQVANVYQELHQQKAFALANANVAGNIIGFNEYQQRVANARNKRLQAIGLGKNLVSDTYSATKAAASSLDNAGVPYANNLKMQFGNWLNADQARFRYDDTDFAARLTNNWDTYHAMQDGSIIRGNQQNYAPNPNTQRGTFSGINYSASLTDTKYDYTSIRNGSPMNYTMQNYLDTKSDWNVINNSVIDSNYGMSYKAPAMFNTDRSALFSTRIPNRNWFSQQTNFENYPNQGGGGSSDGGILDNLF